jgi:hypothetical protein
MNNHQSKLTCNLSRKGDVFYEQSISVYSLHIFDQLTEFHVCVPTSYQTPTAVLCAFLAYLMVG